MNRIITFSLMALNIGIFVWMVVTGTPIFSPTPQELFTWGGNSSDAFMQGDWWRLVTCMFLHSGIIHLAMNMYALYFVGSLLEPALGRSRLLIAYFSTGILASAASSVFHANSYSIGVGASGAIFGLFGVLFALLTTKFFMEEIRQSLTKSIATTIGLNVVYGFQGGIDLAAHIGGLLSGLLVGYCLYLLYSKKAFTFTAITLFTIASTALSLNYLKSTDSLAFYNLTQQLASTDETIETMTSSLSTVPLDQAIFYLDQFIIPEWEQKKALADQMNTLNLSGPKAQHRHFLVEFSYLHTEKLTLISQSLKENTDAYEPRITQINDLLTSLSSPE
jgi:rhomboid protease GluP